MTGHGRDRHSDGHLSNGPLPQPTTERSDTVELVGRLADRLLASGKIPDAVRVLSEHLRNLLGGASAGLPVPENVLALATRYALRLYEWTHRTEWIDYVFRLHLTCRHLPSTAALDALEPVCMAQMDFDRRAVEYLVHALSAPAASTSPDRAARLARLAQLARIPQPR